MSAVSRNKDGSAFTTFRVVLLWICILGGMGLGMLFFVAHSNLFSPWMYTVVAQPLSIVGVFCLSLFPLLICKLALAFNAHIIFYLLCFLKSFCYGFAATGISFAWGSADWLVRCLFLFSDRIVMVALIHIASSAFCDRNRADIFRRYCLAVCLSVLVDKLIISGFLQSIL